MYVPSLAERKALTVPDTLADRTLKAYGSDGIQELYYRIHRISRNTRERLAKFARCTALEGGWQAMDFTFPDHSVVRIYADYGYRPRPNAWDGFAIATVPASLAALEGAGLRDVTIIEA